MDSYAMPIPEGYKEINKNFYKNKISELGLDINDVDGVFLSDSEVVITGTPKEDDEMHNCDEMGCSSISHVLHRYHY